MRCNKNKKRNKTIEHTSNITLSVCLAFNSFVLFVFHLLDSFIFCFPIIFSALCIIYARTHTHTRSQREEVIEWNLIRLCFVCCLLSFVIWVYSLSLSHSHTWWNCFMCMCVCVRIKVVRAHAAVIGNKSHKWKYSRKVCINGLNEFSRVKRVEERETSNSDALKSYIHLYATKTAACSMHAMWTINGHFHHSSYQLCNTITSLVLEPMPVRCLCAIACVLCSLVLLHLHLGQLIVCIILAFFLLWKIRFIGNTVYGRG